MSREFLRTSVSALSPPKAPQGQTRSATSACLPSLVPAEQTNGQPASHCPATPHTSGKDKTTQANQTPSLCRTQNEAAPKENAIFREIPTRLRRTWSSCHLWKLEPRCGSHVGGADPRAQVNEQGCTEAGEPEAAVDEAEGHSFYPQRAEG